MSFNVLKVYFLLSFWLDLCPIELSEELQQLRDMARKFCYEEIIPVAAHHDKTGEVNIHILFKFLLLHVTLFRSAAKITLDLILVVGQNSS